MKTEISTLGSMGIYDIVERDENMNSIKSTWDFKCKHYPDSLIIKLKAQLFPRCWNK